MLSRAYQLQAVPISENANAKDYVFAGPCFKKMSAEQFADAVSALTGVWPAKQDATLSAACERYAKSKWIWSDKNAATSAAPGTVYFRRVIELKSAAVASASAVVACDNQFDLMINGKRVAGGDNWEKPVTVDLAPHLVAGKNVLAVVATNISDQPNPAGLWFNLTIAYQKPDDATPARQMRLEPDVSRRGQSDADVRVRQGQGAEFLEEQRIPEHLRDGVRAEEDSHEHPHEGEEASFSRLESESAREAFEETAEGRGHDG